MPTINGTTSNEYIDAKIVYSTATEITGQYTTITAALYYKRNNTGFTTTGTGTFTISINGTQKTETKTLTITENAWVKAIEFSKKVEVPTNGTVSVVISASGSIPSTTLTSTDVSKTFYINVPRATTIDSLSCETSYFNGKLTYKYTPKNTAMYTRCNIAINLDGTLTAVKTINLGKQSASQQTATVTLSKDELSIIYNKLPSTTKKGTLRFTFRTYSDSGYSTQMGDALHKEITLSIPDISDTQPTATMTISPIHSISLDSPFNTMYLQGMTKVDANFTDGDGKYGADVVSYKLTVGGKSYGSPYTSGYLTTTGSVTVEGIVTDSRGFTRKYTKSITVIPYGGPSILPASGESKIICARCDKDGNLTDSGTYLKIKAMRSYADVKVDGSQKNFCEIRYRCVPEGTKFSGDEGWVTLLAGSTTTTDTVNKTLSGVVSSTEKAYVVQVGVIDDVGVTDAVQFVIPTDFITIDIPEEYEGRRVGLFRYVSGTDKDGVYVGLPLFGGSVDSLKLGTTLTATSTAPIDLNDVKTPGCYYSPGVDYSKYISNSPYSEGGFGLEVREMQSANYIRQTLYYGRTTWIRHWDSKEWSGWVRFLATDIDASFAKDFVIEKGTGNGWTYKKWKGGTYEMFGYFTVTAKAAGTAYGSMYYSEQFKLPIPFRVKTAVVAGTATNWFIPITGGVSNGADGEDPYENIGIRLFRPKEFAVGQDSSIRLHVTGEYE